jgi:hypothetical protein
MSAAARWVPANSPGTTVMRKGVPQTMRSEVAERWVQHLLHIAATQPPPTPAVMRHLPEANRYGAQVT